MAPGMVVRDQYELSHLRSRPHLRPTSTDVRSRRPHRREARRRRHRGRSRRPHRRLPAAQARRCLHHPRGRRPGRRHQPHRRARRLALRHRRPPLLHQGPRGRGVLARDPAGRGLPHAAPQEPHLLQRQVPRLPAAAREHVQGGRSDRRRAVRPLLPLGPHPSTEGPDQLRGLAGRALRLAPLPDVLQDLHREGVGRAGLVDAGRLGRAAGQGARPRQGDRQHAPAEAEPEGHHLPHRGVPVPEARSRDDVGGLPSTRSWRRARPCTCGPASPGCATRTVGPSRSRPPRPTDRSPATPATT